MKHKSLAKIPEVSSKETRMFLFTTPATSAFNSEQWRELCAVLIPLQRSVSSSSFSYDFRVHFLSSSLYYLTVKGPCPGHVDSVVQQYVTKPRDFTFLSTCNNLPARKLPLAVRTSLGLNTRRRKTTAAVKLDCHCCNFRTLVFFFAVVWFISILLFVF